MRHDQFIGQVQHRARLADQGQAERATRAVLETLAERVPDGLADNLAAQLPHEVGEHLRRYQSYAGLGTGEHFSVGEFIDRVSERSGLDGPKAAFAVRSVCEVVGEATSGNVMNKVADSLPKDLQQLVTAGSSGTMSDGGQ